MVAQLYPHLQSQLLSPSRPLRSNVLGLLTSKMVKSSPAEHEALKRCLQGDEVSLDMHGVRERVLRIGRLYQVVRDDGSLSADICVRWLVCTYTVPFMRHFINVASAQLKVNLRPIWSPASQALSSLAQNFGNVVWNIIFSELQQPQGANQIPDWLTATKDDQNVMDPWEEERSWRDPTAHRVRGTAVSWLDKFHHRKIIISVSLLVGTTSFLLMIGYRNKNRLIGLIPSHSKLRSSSLSGNAHLWWKNITAS
jgi:U3 small nucleolar RNA-associated protein 20